jgi:hypothetical protein
LRLSLQKGAGSVRAFAAYVLRGRTQAVLVSTVFGLFALLLPPLSYLSGGVVALVALRHGPWEGLLVIAGALVASAVLGLLAIGSYLPSLVLTLALWLPLWLLAVTLRRTVSLTLAVELGALLGLLWVLGMYAWLQQPAVWWEDALQGVKHALEQVEPQGGPGDLDRRLRALAQMMTGALAAAVVLSLLLNLFLARWWQSLLFRPGGFRSEFHGLRLGHAASMLVLGMFALAALGEGTPAAIAGDGAWVALAVCLLCGLALAHGLAARLNVHWGWLAGLYALLALDPIHVVPILAAAALADSWLNLRRYFQRGGEA